MDLKICSTVGYELQHNELLRVPDEPTFVARAITGLGPQPPNFKAIVELNKGELLTDGVELMPLTPRQIEQRQAGGALVVDVRTDLQFDEAHIPGALCIPALHAGFGTRLAWLAERDQETLLVGRDDLDARHAGTLALAVGIRKLGGYLSGGMTQWRNEQRPVQRVERVALEQLPELVDSIQVLDVREQSERDDGFIPGSLFTPWHDLVRLPPGLRPEDPAAVICASGQRAAVAASLLQRLGVKHVIHVVGGGVGTWGQLGHPLEVPERAAA